MFPNTKVNTKAIKLELINSNDVNVIYIAKIK